MPKPFIFLMTAFMASQPAAAAGGFAEAPCWFEDRGDFEIACGTLAVPEERGAPATRTLHLPVVIFKGTVPEGERPPRPEPLLVLNGGPGGSNFVRDGTFLEVWGPFVEALQVPAARDVILFSQRGTDNEAALAATCPVFTEPEYFLGAARRRGRQTDWRVNVTKGLADCRAKLSKAGYPIAAYSTEANLADLKNLRAALGLERIAVYGVSYGAKLALELARHDGAGLTRLILDSPSPPEGDYTFRYIENLLGAVRRLEEICGRYRLCRAHRYIEKNLMRLLDRLAERPREIRIRSGVGRGKARALYVRLDPAVLVDVLLFSFYFPERTLRIPEALSEAVTGELELIARLAGEAYFYDTGINYVTNTSVFCQDVPTAVPVSAVRREMGAYPEFRHFLDYALWLHEKVCPLWLPAPQIHADEAPAPLSVPALILSGGLDPVTPEAAARSLPAALPASRVVFAPEATHGVLPQSRCVQDEVASFLEGRPATTMVC